MLVPVEWIKDYADFDISPEILAERLTMAGLEVEDISELEGMIVFSTYVTPNRPDLLSVTGVAREVSALLSSRFSLPIPKLSESGPPVSTMATVSIESPEDCPRYSARIVTDVQVVESPDWVKKRLTASGLRPINNVVDATNYVLLELGQPLHAFDYDLLDGKTIIVRRAVSGERLTTIDGEERQLSSEMLVIADARRPVALAGIMGGLETEVSAQTKCVLLESANFNRLSIRKTAKTLEMNTEASYRFERGVDPETTILALDRAAELIVETGGGKITQGVLDVYPGQVKPITLTIRPKRTAMVLGLEITPDEIANYLTRLGMKVLDKKENNLKIQIPTFRPDIQREEDLIEEVGHLHGYDRIPEKLICGETTEGHDSREGEFAERVSAVLVAAGLEEVVTGSMTSPNAENNQVIIRNPLSDDLSRLRKRLVLDILDIVAYNTTRGIRDIGIFEIGRVFEQQDGQELIVEKLSVAAAITGTMWGPVWNVDKSCLEADFFLCKGIVENLLDRLGVQKVRFKPAKDSIFHPTRTAVIETETATIGLIGQVAPGFAEQTGVPPGTCAFELDFPCLMEIAGGLPTYEKLSRYPPVSRDLALVVPEAVTYETVKNIIAHEAEGLLETLSLFDVYKGAPLATGQKSFAFNIVFRACDRTLRDDEVNAKLADIRRALETEVGASFRDA